MISITAKLDILRIETIASVLPTKAVIDLNACSLDSTKIVSDAITYYTTEKGHYIYTYNVLRDIQLPELHNIELLFANYKKDVQDDNKNYWILK